MSIDYKKYPSFWKPLRIELLIRANNQCECHGECGKHPEQRCDEIHNLKAKSFSGFVVLTIAHLDHDETNHNVKSERLKAMCQACHLRYDLYDNKHRKSLNKHSSQLNLEFE